MNKIKTKENIEIPNKPILYNDQYAIKLNLNGEFVRTNESDTSWYNYDNKKWALAIKQASWDENKEKIKENPEIYAWIPRFFSDSENSEIKFIISNGYHYIDANGEIKTITEGKIPSEFTQNEEQVNGRWAIIDINREDLSIFNDSDLKSALKNLKE